MPEPTPDKVVTQAETTQDERTMAVLAHVLQLVGGWIAPLIIFFAKRQSRFVSFHSLQVLFLELVFLLLNLFLTMFLIVGFLLAFLNAHGGNNAPPLALLLTFPVFWLGLTGAWVVKLVIAVVYSINAGRGEWAEYPFLGALARSCPEYRAGRRRVVNAIRFFRFLSKSRLHVDCLG
jgi:uncharacterized membrane protein